MYGLQLAAYHSRTHILLENIHMLRHFNGSVVISSTLSSLRISKNGDMCTCMAFLELVGKFDSKMDQYTERI